jgi:hypothetical protein
MPELRRAYFDRCHTSLTEEWLRMPIDGWDETIRRREQAILQGMLQIEERAIALLERVAGM